MELKLEAKVHEYGNRDIRPADRSEPEKLGALSKLPGKWINAKEGLTTGFEGRGWNMIALPFFTDASGDFRVLANQYNETLDFLTVDGPVPNRGVDKEGSADATAQTDQTIFGLDYTQRIAQIAVKDAPPSSDMIRGKIGAGIHHEPGFMLWIRDQHTFIDYVVRTPAGDECETKLPLNVARLASIPHGDTVTAMGVSFTRPGAPLVPEISGLPVHLQSPPGEPDPELTGYLAPYGDLSGDNKFEGLFDVSRPWELLRGGIAALGPIRQTTTLHFNTEFATGGIVNIPFIVSEANATAMEAFFWIMELEEPINGRGWALAYIQNVLLDFFPQFGGPEGALIRWPHVSINIMCLDEAPAREPLHKPEEQDASNG